MRDLIATLEISAMAEKMVIKYLLIFSFRNPYLDLTKNVGMSKYLIKSHNVGWKFSVAQVTHLLYGVVCRDDIRVPTILQFEEGGGNSTIFRRDLLCGTMAIIVMDRFCIRAVVHLVNDINNLYSRLKLTL